MDWNAIGTWLGLAVSVGGFWIAIAQIRKTRKAVDAARDAAARTGRQLALNQLLMLLPQLQQIDSDIGLAVATDQREATLRLLARWRHSTSEVRGLISRAALVEPALVEKLVQTVALAVVATETLVSSDRATPAATRRVRPAIGQAASEVGELLGRLGGYTGGDQL